MDTKLAQHFTYGKLLKFVFPSICHDDFYIYL